MAAPTCLRRSVSHRRARWLPLLVSALLVSVMLAPPAFAQSPPPSGAPTPHIVPRPNSGHPPTDAGDRGGALQLLVLGLLIVAVAGSVAHVVRQSRRARSAEPR
ncbi:MAG: hypothetical protein ACT4OV_09750 [Microthrixaceae bacterium]